MNIIKSHDYNKSKNRKQYDYLISLKQEILKNDCSRLKDYKIKKINSDIEFLKYDILIDELLDCYNNF